MKFFRLISILKNGYFADWNTDYKLEKSMQSFFNKDPYQNQEYWWLYWFKEYEKNNEIAKSHLQCYLEETRYLAAQKMWDKLNELNLDHFSDSKADYCSLIMNSNKLDEILKKFDPKFHNSNLKGYAYVSFKRLLIDELKEKYPTIGISNWTLLYWKTSETKLRKSLESDGISEKEIEVYILVWDCFKKIYQNYKAEKKNKTLPEPDKKTWEEIANLYEAERKQNYSVYREVKYKEIKTLIKNSIKARKSYEQWKQNLQKTDTQNQYKDYENKSLDDEALNSINVVLYTKI